MQPWKLILAYDGTSFHGWQVQPHLPSVQGTLAQALHQITGERVLPQGSGRTDAGVHALAQVTSFTLAAPIPPANLLRALNRALPPSIRVLSATHVPETFHARHCALRKTYEYRIFPRVQPGEIASSTQDKICPPFLAPYVWDCPWPFAIEPAQQAATHILGEHDFTTFAASDPDLANRESAEPRNNIRSIYQSTWSKQGGLLIYRVTGSGFLHHMVRNLVGTFVDVAAGRLEPSAMPRILTLRKRCAAGPTAPAQGLFLVSVEYPE